MATTATVESTATHTTAMEAAATDVTMNSTTGEAVSNRAAAITATVRNRASITVTGTSITVTCASIPITRASIHRPSIVAAAIAIVASAEPGARADKEATAKPGRSIVSIRRAGVGIVAVVAIGTDGGRITISPVHRATNPYSHGNLSMGNRCGREQQDTQYSEIA
jgi:hypothetical protein